MNPRRKYLVQTFAWILIQIITHHVSFKSTLVDAQTCELPPAISNGSVSITGTDNGSLATYTCDEGYVITGNDMLACVASEGWTPDIAPTCDDMDECSSSPCLHGGTCIDQLNEYACTCEPGFIGVNCQDEIDECASDPCTNATCHDQVNGYVCVCNAGFDGPDCETDADDCVTVTCLNDGTCVDDIFSYTCDCISGFEGKHCEINTDDCGAAPCMNGGTCTDRGDNYTCTCPVGFTGYDCETDIDECVSSPCLNGGTCSDQLNTFACSCTAGFGGVICGVDCGPPPIVESSTMVTPTDTYTLAVTTYSCALGLTVFGNASIMCLENGQWEDAPTYRKMYGEDCFLSLQCLTRNSTCVSNVHDNNKCSCTDSLSYYEATLDECVADCGGLPSPTNGEVALPSNTAVGQIVSYSCDHGYALTGSATRVCQPDGLWSGQVPLCIPGCYTPTPPINGNVNTTLGLKVGGTILYTCNDGYALVGPSERTCLSTLQWSGSESICAKECPYLTSIDNGQIDVSQGNWKGSTAVYICNDDYALVGTSARTCQDTGLWSGVEPECKYAMFSTAIIVIGVILAALIVFDIVVVAICCYRSCNKKKNWGYNGLFPNAFDQENGNSVPPLQHPRPIFHGMNQHIMPKHVRVGPEEGRVILRSYPPPQKTKGTKVNRVSQGRHNGEDNPRFPLKGRHKQADDEPLKDVGYHTENSEDARLTDTDSTISDVARPHNATERHDAGSYRLIESMAENLMDKGALAKVVNTSIPSTAKTLDNLKPSDISRRRMQESVDVYSSERRTQ